MREQLLAGSTLAEILTANGVDVDAFVTEKSGDFSAQLTEALNTQIPQADAEAEAGA